MQELNLSFAHGNTGQFGGGTIEQRSGAERRFFFGIFCFDKSWWIQKKDNFFAWKYHQCAFKMTHKVHVVEFNLITRK